MTVVRNEYERGRNNPFELLDEEMMYQVFTKHPYRIPTIGLKEDIEGSTAKKLRGFYDTFYWPSNATLSVYGDVPWSKVEKLVLAHFGIIPAAPHKIPELKVKEPVQTKPRKVHLTKDMGVTIVQNSYKIPEGRHKDFAAVYVAVATLGSGFGSRLQRALVDTGLASGVSTFCMPLFDPGLANITAQCTSMGKPAKVQEVIRTELAKLGNEGVAKDELARVKERILTEAAQERDGVFTEIRVTSEAIAAGDWTLAYSFPKQVAKITSADVRRVVKKYFAPNKETSGVLEPK
jgi:zinc protease